MTRILLVRHGQSAWNAGGRWQGWADPPLTELGVQQAVAAGSSVGTVDAVVASDLQRSIRTAMVIADATGAGPVVVEPGLKERDVGEWTGHTRAEIAERWPETFAAFLATPGDGPAFTGPVTPPGGETVEAVLARVVAAVHRVAELVGPDGDALAVSHGGVIRALERHLGREPAPIPNLGGLWVSVEGGQLAAGDRVLLIDPGEVAVTVPRQL